MLRRTGGAFLGRTTRVTEAELQEAVVGVARTLGWRVAHVRPARTEKGWRTAWSYDGKGFVDLTLVREWRLLFVELKGERGKVAPEQQGWLDALDETPNEVHVWRPRDWLDGTVERVLR